MFGRLGPLELLLILAAILLVFGPKRLPQIGKALGDALRNLRSHASALEGELDTDEKTRRNAADRPPIPNDLDSRDADSGDSASSNSPSSGSSESGRS